MSAHRSTMVRRLAGVLAAVALGVGCNSGAAAPSDGAAGGGGSISGLGGTGGGVAGSGGGAGAGAGGGGNAVGGAGGSAGAGGTGAPGIPSVTIALQENAIGPTTQLAPNIQITNTGAGTLSMYEMSIRYWFTSDVGAATGVTQLAECYGTVQVICDHLADGTGPVIHGAADGRHLLEPRLFGAGLALPRTYASMLTHITRSDGGTYDQSNDYSYNGSGGAFMTTTRVTGYYNHGVLFYGVEP